MRLLFSILFLSNFCFAQTRRPVILSVGSDMTSNIRLTISDQNAKIIEIERPGGGDIKVVGTLDFKGKVLRLTQGTKLTGSFIISNPVIDAAYNQQIFDANAKIINATVTGSMVSVKWFGATGNGVADDGPAIIRAGEAVIGNLALPRALYFPAGTYITNQPLFFSNFQGSDYQFFTLNLIGEQNTHFTSAEYSTRIIYTGTDGFAIGYQRARSSLIKGLWIQGPFNPNIPYIAAQFARPYATFAAGVDDTRYAPLQGIAIDPVMNWDDPNSEYVPVSGRYQKLLNLYRGSGTRGGTSAVNITECRILGFAVGIGYSLNGHTLNGENCTIEKVSFDNCKAAIAFGQAQIKNNYIRQIISWGGVHTVIDADTYGSVSGLRPTPAFIDGMNLAGGINRIFNVNSNFTFAAQNIYAELLFEIGRIESAAPWSIKYSTFHFPDEASVPFFPEYHLKGTSGSFETCDFKVYDDKFNKRMIIRGDKISFLNCRFDRPPLEQLAGKEKHRVEYANCYTGKGLDFGFSQNNTQTGTFNFESIRTRGKTVYDMGCGTKYMPLYSCMTVEFESTKMDDIIVPSANYTAITKIGNELHFTLAPFEAGRLNVNDYICEKENTFPKFYYETGQRDIFPVYGRIKSISPTGAIVLTDVPKHIGSTPQAFIYASREHLNTISEGTTIITNELNTPLSGDAVDLFAYPVSVGTIWKFKYQKWICTKGGYLNAVKQGKTEQAEFKTIN